MTFRQLFLNGFVWLWHLHSAKKFELTKTAQKIILEVATRPNGRPSGRRELLDTLAVGQTWRSLSYGSCGMNHMVHTCGLDRSKGLSTSPSGRAFPSTLSLPSTLRSRDRRAGRSAGQALQAWLTYRYNLSPKPPLHKMERGSGGEVLQTMDTFTKTDSLQIKKTISPKTKGSFKPYGLIGLIVIITAEILLFLKVKPVMIFFTPLVWTGYILFVDNLILKLQGESLIYNRRKEFFLMFPISVALWLIFEFYNIFLDNWHYINLPENIWIRLIGFTWSFATIWPAILETAELFRVLHIFDKIKIRERSISPKILRASIGFGAIFLIIPIAFPSRYLAVLVWLGFVLFLDPINYFFGTKSLFRDLEKGKLNNLFSLLLSGLTCGLLWEFWNYWALSKWIYTVPILGNIKIFEMPVVGYLGFLPFAVECYIMYNSIGLIFRHTRNRDEIA